MREAALSLNISVWTLPAVTRSWAQSTENWRVHKYKQNHMKVMKQKGNKMNVRKGFC